MTMILSGMSNMAQMQDNLATFDHPEPLSAEEQALLLEIAEGFKSAVPCTACRYCCDGCPQEIDIPQMLRVLNELRVVPSTNAIMAVEALPKSRKPQSCLGWRVRGSLSAENRHPRLYAGAGGAHREDPELG